MRNSGRQKQTNKKLEKDCNTKHGKKGRDRRRKKP